MYKLPKLIKSLFIYHKKLEKFICYSDANFHNIKDFGKRRQITLFVFYLIFNIKYKNG